MAYNVLLAIACFQIQDLATGMLTAIVTTVPSREIPDPLTAGVVRKHGCDNLISNYFGPTTSILIGLRRFNPSIAAVPDPRACEGHHSHLRGKFRADTRE